MINELIQANEMFFMNFWYIEHYGACFGEGIDDKMNYFKHTKWLFNYLISTVLIKWLHTTVGFHTH